MSQESDVCCTTSMYDIQNRCIPDEIDLFNLTLMYPCSIFCPYKNLIHFRRFLVIWEFRVTENWVASRLKGVASRLKMGL